MRGCRRAPRPARLQAPGCPWRPRCRAGRAASGSADTDRAPAARPRPPGRSPRRAGRALDGQRVGPAEQRQVGDAFQRAGQQIDHQRIAEVEARRRPREEVGDQQPRSGRDAEAWSATRTRPSTGLRNTAISPGQGTACAATSGRCAGWSSVSCGRSISTVSGAPNTTARVSEAARGSPGGRS